MANLFDFIRGLKKADVQPVQVAENGGLDLQATMELAKRQPKTTFERLFGRNIEIDTDTQNPETGEITTERVVKFQPGMLNDIASGARENYTTGFAASNLQDKIGTEGQNKGLAYRMGEGAGTLGRGLNRGANALGRGLRKVGQFANTPLGRAVIMGGLVGATGGSGLEMLAYGSSAGLMNQQNRMKDQMYRNELQKMGFDTSGINGYIGDDTFNKIFQSKQLQDNAEYRNALLETNRINQQFVNQMAKDKLEYQKQQDERDYNLDRERIAQGWANVENNKAKIQKGNAKFKTAIGDKQNALSQIREMRKLIEANPNATGYIVGKFAKGQEAAQKFANEVLSKDPEAIKTRAAIAKLRGTTMHDLAGTAQTLQEQRNLAPFLPDATDNSKTILAKLEQLEKELSREMATLTDTGYELGYDVDDFTSSQPTSTNINLNVDRSKLEAEMKRRGML